MPDREGAQNHRPKGRAALSRSTCVMSAALPKIAEPGVF
jgi:hypothetical protein